jgi:hypothetical protein
MPRVGRHAYPGLTFKPADTPNSLRTPPPRLREHNEEIYLDLLVYSRDELGTMQAAGLVGTHYPITWSRDPDPTAPWWRVRSGGVAHHGMRVK